MVYSLPQLHHWIRWSTNSIADTPCLITEWETDPMVSATSTMSNLDFPWTVTMATILSSTLAIAAPSWSMIVSITLSPSEVNHDE